MEKADQQVAWVTGAGKGIGRALAKRLSEEGWVVAASARTKNDLASLQEEAVSAKVHTFPLDITNATATKEAIERIETELGRLSLVVLNAGTYVPMSANTFNLEKFRKLVETNLMGTANGLAHIMPKFIGRKAGHIAVVGSLAGYRGLPTSAAYGATKAGLINMCEALRPELEYHGVRLTLISPGFVETPLTDKNDFPMPFLIPVDEAVENIMRGLNGSTFEISFPGRFAFLMKILRILPDWLFFKLTYRMIGE
jgi:NADP-dependent 3-hydroxy acid dehydrogenase YdfG